MLLFSFGDWIHISNTYIIDVCVFSNYHLHKANDKIKVNETETSRFWSHFKSFIGPHPAIDEHERNPSQPWHLPIGVSGDDARYTLAGRKIIIMMISSVLQQIESVLSLSVLKICMVCFFFMRSWCIDFTNYYHFHFVQNQVLTSADFRSFSYDMKSPWAPEAWTQFWELLRGA